jgi:hypothetical protein
MAGLNGAVADAEIMQVGNGSCQRGAQPRDDLNRLGAFECGQVPARDPAQHQSVGRIATLHGDEVHDAGMGDGAQDGGFVRQAPAGLRIGGPLVDPLRSDLAGNIHLQ